MLCVLHCEKIWVYEFARHCILFLRTFYTVLLHFLIWDGKIRRFNVFQSWKSPFSHLFLLTNYKYTQCDIVFFLFYSGFKVLILSFQPFFNYIFIGM